MTGPEIRDALTAARLTQTRAAALCGTSEDTIGRAARDGCENPLSVLLALLARRPELVAELDGGALSRPPTPREQVMWHLDQARVITEAEMDDGRHIQVNDLVVMRGVSNKRLLVQKIENGVATMSLEGLSPGDKTTVTSPLSDLKRVNLPISRNDKATG
jgi:transcriptional regulator with XRE-family HTH domain